MYVISVKRRNQADDAFKNYEEIRETKRYVTIEHVKAKDANIATAYNWNPKAKQLTYGTAHVELKAYDSNCKSCCK